MRLHVIFNESFITKLSLTEMDVYLTTEKSVFNYLNKGGYQCYLLDPNNFDNQEIKIEAVKTLFNQIEVNLEPLMNDVYSRALLPIFSTIIEIDNIIKKEMPEEIYLYGGAKSLYFVVEQGEGESGEPFLYKREWMLNYWIYLAIHKTNKIVWKYRTSKIIQKLRLVFRSQYLYFGTCLKSLVIAVSESLKSNKTNNNIKIDNRKKTLLIPFLIKNQGEHLSRFCEKLNLRFNLIYLSFERHNIGLENYIIPPTLSIKDIFKLMLETRRDLKKIKNCHIVFNEHFINLPASVLKTSLKRTYVKYLIHKRRYELLVEDQTIRDILPSISLLINNKTFGWFAYLDKELARMIGVRLITFQYVAISKRILPYFNTTDKYYTNSKELYEFLKIYTDIVRYSGMALINEEIKTISENEKPTISIFTQPDDYHKKYVELVKSIEGIIQSIDCNVKINIKPHYRQNELNSFNTVVQRNKGNMTLAGSEESATEIIQKSNIVVSIWSSVILEAICLGIPTVVVALDPEDMGKIENIPFLQSNANYLIKTIEELKVVFSSPKVVVDHFNYYRPQYIKSEFVSVNDVIDKLVDENLILTKKKELK